MNSIPRLLAVAATFFCLPGFSSPLVVSTWGGNHAQVLRTEIITPYTAAFGVAIEHTGNVENRDAASGMAGVVELTLSDTDIACDSGDLLLLPTNELGDTAEHRNVIHDFVPNALHPCAVGHSIWSTVSVFDENRYAMYEQPHLVSDFFDINHFPGKRAIRRSPRVLAEWALVAGGVMPTQIYDVLNDIDLSWPVIAKQLQAIEDHIIWVDSDVQAVDLVESGHVAFAMLGSESIVREAALNQRKLGVLWDAAVTELSLWAIPEDAPDPEKSWQFMKYAAATPNSGKVASFFGYGAVRYSALALMDKEYQEILPSWPANQRNLIWSNSQWWDKNGDALNERFSQWVMDIERTSDIKLATVSENLTESTMDLRSGVSMQSGKYLQSDFLPATTIGYPIH